MSDKEPIAWFTINGRHIPVFEGDTEEEVRKRVQIKKNSDTVNKLNENSKTSPKNLKLENIKAEDANKTTDILRLGTSQRYRFKEGTDIRNVYVFAGSGTSTEFRDAKKYAKRYGGKAEDWRHCTGNAIITNGNVTLRREVHWVQGKDGKMREAFIKVRREYD